MKRFKLNFAVIAFILGSVIALTQSAFTPVKKAGVARTGTNYVFNGTTAAESQMATFYSVKSGTPSCDEADVLPCEIDNISGSLQTWLNARSQEQILVAASHTKD